MCRRKNKDRYDLKVKPVPFGVGDWVYYYCPRRRVGKSVKWTKFYSGPFLVVKVLGPVNLLIQKNARSKAQVVHVDKVKRCLGPTPKTWVTGETAENTNEFVPTAELTNAEGPIVAEQNDGTVDQAPVRRPIAKRRRNEPEEEPRVAPNNRPKRNAPRPSRYLLRAKDMRSGDYSCHRVPRLRCC